MFTENQMQILAVLINNPDKEYYLSELGQILGKAPGVFQRGINSLEEQKIIVSHKRGNQRLFNINTEHPFFNETKGIVQKTYGVEGLLKDVVKKIKGISIALIYGSYAKGKMRPDSDIDILIVGSRKADDIFLDKIAKLEKKLQREINYKIYTDKEFLEKRKSVHPFVKEILSDKYILLKGEL